MAKKVATVIQDGKVISQAAMRRYKTAKSELDRLKKELTEALEEGLKCEPGDLKAYLQDGAFRSSFSPKDHLVSLIGKDEYDALVDASEKKQNNPSLKVV